MVIIIFLELLFCRIPRFRLGGNDSKARKRCVSQTNPEIVPQLSHNFPATKRAYRLEHDEIRVNELSVMCAPAQAGVLVVRHSFCSHHSGLRRRTLISRSISAILLVVAQWAGHTYNQIGSISPYKRLYGLYRVF